MMDIGSDWLITDSNGWTCFIILRTGFRWLMTNCSWVAIDVGFTDYNDDVWRLVGHANSIGSDPRDDEHRPGQQGDPSNRSHRRLRSDWFHRNLPAVLCKALQELGDELGFPPRSTETNDSVIWDLKFCWATRHKLTTRVHTTYGEREREKKIKWKENRKGRRKKERKRSDLWKLDWDI